MDGMVRTLLLSCWQLQKVTTSVFGAIFFIPGETGSLLT